VSAATLRIGDVARRAGTTARTIRYYEEIGLLPQAAERPPGGHRCYGDADVAHLRELVRLRDLLGLSLEELKTLVEAEQVRAHVRARLREDDVAPAERRALLEQGLGHLDRQLALVRRRAAELARLEDDLQERRKKGRRMLRELNAQAGGAYPPVDSAVPSDAPS
jgi:DNA-binding transcriptional MerR regulator